MATLVGTTAYAYDANGNVIPPPAPAAPGDIPVDKIKVPTYAACQWTDEQTGGHCPTLAEHMTGTKLKWFNFTNGAVVPNPNVVLLDPVTGKVTSGN